MGEKHPDRTKEWDKEKRALKNIAASILSRKNKEPSPSQENP